MNSPPRTYTRLALAIVAAALVIAATIAISAFGTVTVTRTLPEISTSIVTATITVTSSNSTQNSTSTAPAAGRLYEVIFRQTGDCTPIIYADPWSVTLGSWSVAEPSNTTLPISTNSGNSEGPTFVNETTIVFSVPDGQYSYSVSMGGWNIGNPLGTVTVQGADVMIVVQGPLVSCTVQTVTTG